LGDAYRDLGDTARARDSLERALAIKEAHYGREHSELVITLLKLTVIYHMLKQQNNSFNTFQRACRIRANHPITKQDRKALSDNLFSYWNKYKKPLGVAAVVVGIGTVYIARSRKLFR
jgi:tetratricopeptide (TPR) repeat protein